MKNINEIFEKYSNDFNSLNDDYLTEKELDKTCKFLDDLSKKK